MIPGVLQNVQVLARGRHALGIYTQTIMNFPIYLLDLRFLL